MWNTWIYFPPLHELCHFESFLRLVLVYVVLSFRPARAFQLLDLELVLLNGVASEIPNSTRHLISVWTIHKQNLVHNPGSSFKSLRMLPSLSVSWCPCISRATSFRTACRSIGNMMRSRSCSISCSE